ESASDAKSASVHISVTRDRRENLCRAFDHFLVAPKELSRLGINSDDAFAEELNILFSTAALHDNRRRITCLVSTRNRRFPNEGASLCVKRQHRSRRAAG